MIIAVYITLWIGGHCKYLKHENHGFESCYCKLTASSKVEASRGERVMLILLLARKAKNMRIEVEQSGFGGGKVTELGIPIQFKLEPGQVDPEIPELGEHTHAVLGALGLTSQEVVQASGLAPRAVQ